MLLFADAILVIFLLGLSRKITSQIQIAESFRRCRCQKEENEEEESAENLFFLIFSWLLFISSAIFLLFFPKDFSWRETAVLVAAFQFILSLCGMFFLGHKKAFHVILSEYGFKAVFAATIITGVFVAFLLAIFS
ncbi:hypothetical protein K9K85_01290 [Patescibacteria group bacterium]|nr:hypothetical protein [Patescibacteria group bacterium]